MPLRAGPSAKGIRASLLPVTKPHEPATSLAHEPWYVKPCSWGLDYFIRPLVFLLDEHRLKVYFGFMTMFVCFGVVIARASTHLVAGCGNGNGSVSMNASGATSNTSVSSGCGDKGALKFLAQTPFTPVLLAVATQMILAMFGWKQLQHFGKQEAVPLPILYPFTIGKGFMVLRLFMAYHSLDLGQSLDFFVYQEMLLMGAHVLCSSCLLTFVPQDPAKLCNMVWVFRFVFFMDAAKTGFNYILFLNFQPGVIKAFINALPDLTSQVCASLVIHGILDFMQSATTIFTMFFSRWMRLVLSNVQCLRMSQPLAEITQRLPDQKARDDQATENKIWYHNRCFCFFKSEATFVKWNMVHVDAWWCRHLFMHGYGCKHVPANFDSVEKIAKNEMDCIAGCYKFA